MLYYVTWALIERESCFEMSEDSLGQASSQVVRSDVSEQATQEVIQYEIGRASCRERVCLYV